MADETLNTQSAPTPAAPRAHDEQSPDDGDGAVTWARILGLSAISPDDPPDTGGGGGSKGALSAPGA